MPVIEIRSLPFEQAVDIPEVLRTLNKSVAKAIGYEERHIWSTWQYLQPGYYAVGGETAGKTSTKKHSPVVRILSFEGKSRADIKQLLKTTATVLAEQLNIDISNIFIEYAEAHSGMVFDGGQVVVRR